MDKITFCIPSKSNLEYLKTCIPSIRNNAHRDDHEIIIFVDEDNDGTVEWLEENQQQYNITYYVNPELGGRLYGIGKAYDYCVEKSTTDIFMIFHADMILGKNADLNAFNHLKPKSVVCSTRIEPPIHPNNGEKIQRDFGMYPNEFKTEHFDTFVDENSNETKTTDGIFAPWMMYKNEFLSLGGHDPRMHSCREDSDVFNRMALDGFEFIQVWNSLVYHFTGRGAGSFEGDHERHLKWQQDMLNSTREFIRKWGSNVNHTSLMKPIVSPKYDITYRVHSDNLELMKALEPWCSKYYTDLNSMALQHYVATEQPRTKDNLKTKINPLEAELYDEDENGVTVIIDGANFTRQDYQFLEVLNGVIQEANQTGEFELGNMKVQINNLATFEKDLIFITND
jgi:glycosyltransferase involved in cell wall biosynthesis